MTHLVPFLALVLACRAPDAADKPYVSDFDTSCAVVDDCRAVVERGLCGCSCDRWVGINQQDEQAFLEAQESFHDAHTCESHCLKGCGNIADASEVTLSCDEGSCTAEAPSWWDTGY